MTCESYYVTTEHDVAADHIDNVGHVTGREPHGGVVTADDPLDVPEEHAPGISIVKTAGEGTFTAAGTPVTYYYLVTNNGDVALHQVTVTGSQGLALSCPLTSLAPGQAMTCTARYVTTLADTGGGDIIINTGSDTGKTPDGGKVRDAATEFPPFAGFFFPVTG
jgi:hypothetical protein